MSSSTEFFLEEACLCIISYLHTLTSAMYGKSEEWNRCADYISERVDCCNEHLRNVGRIPNADTAETDGGER